MMDAKSRKAMFREKKKEKGEKRIDSPLVRYNELDQAVCRVCNVVIKSDPLWPAHQGSRKHKEAVEDIKARAAKSKTANNSKSTNIDDGNTDTPLSSSVPAQSRPASSLPASFFDEPDAKRQNRVSQEEASNSTASAKNLKKMTSETIPSKSIDLSIKEKKHPSDVSDMMEKGKEKFPSVRPEHASNLIEESETNQVKGSLPEGFFDNKDADLRARGLEPVKYDIKDEWKEFQKTIREDLQEVDYRLEEEEFDAAEVREEMELIEQRAYVERVEMLKNKQQELSMLKASTQVKSPSYMGAESSDVSLSDEDENENNYLIDWRAKRF